MLNKWIEESESTGIQLKSKQDEQAEKVNEKKVVKKSDGITLKHFHTLIF